MAQTEGCHRARGKKLMQDTFSTYHPLINFAFFVAVIVFGMFFVHPLFLGIGLFSAICYSAVIKGRKALKFALKMIPLFLLVTLVNPLFNSLGETVLFTLPWGRPYTFEAMLYGMATGAMLLTVMIWFSCYHVVMTSDKFIYLFGRIIPSISLVFSMVLRFVPIFKMEIKTLSNAQKCVGRDISNGTKKEKLAHGATILSMLMSWALENAVCTADSMKSRGYGLAGRTSFSIYRFDLRDGVAAISLLLLTLGVAAGALLGRAWAVFVPRLILPPLDGWGAVCAACYGLLCLFPSLISVLEDIKWRALKSRI